MATPEEIEQQFEETALALREVLTADETTTITLPGGGTVRSMKKIDKDAADAIAATIAGFGNDKVDKTSIGSSGGIPSLSGFKLIVKNTAGLFPSFLQSLVTAQRTWTLPDQDGVLATTADIAAKMGIPNGLATLDVSGLVPSSQLPSYVDDVIEYDTKALLLAANNGAGVGTGVKGKIYVVDADESDGGKTNQYRWSGSSYIKMVSSPGTTDEVLEGVTNLYFTGGRAIASLLTGLSTASTAVVTAADTVLSSIGKLQAQYTALATANTGDETTASIKTKLGVATLSGSNTGDETLATIKAKLGVATLSGSNTGDETTATVLAKLGIATLSGSNTGDETTATIQTKLGYVPVNPALIGAVNGLATLDSNGLVPAGQLPSYVDDILEYDTKALLTAASVASGAQTKGKIYVVDADESDSGVTNQYRWSGSAYVKLVPSPGTTDAVVEGATNKYFTAARAIASVLTGLSTATATVPTAADTILVAIGKLAALWGTKDTASGFPGLSATYGINIKNSTGTNTSVLTSTSTANRVYSFPDKNLQVAGLADVLPTVAAGLVFSDASKALATDTILAIMGKLQAQINAIPFDIMTFVGGKAAVSGKTLYVQAGRAFTIPANFTGSKVKALTAATAASVWTLTRNGASIGTFSWAVSGTVPTLATAGGVAINIAVGDELLLTAAATQDATLADVGVHILATLT